MAQSLRGRVAVITGGSTGIGYGMAQALAKRGCRLVLGARRKDELESAAASLRRGGRETRAVPCDVTIPQQVRRLVDAAVDRWDRLDVVVANAGVGLAGPFVETPREDLRLVFDVNVHGVLNTLQASLPVLIERGGGSVVIVSSVLGFRGVPGFSGYCATKFALNGLAESLRTELAPKGIHVLLACPGLTNTRFAERRLGPGNPEPMREGLRAMDPGDAGERIVKALARGRSRVVLTPGGRFLASLARHFPRIADRALDSWHRRLEASPAGQGDGTA